ncbi:MAG: DNA internalization-related competence protein ComEC/Rec2, partial [Phoenicibacter congonensis]|nr:DNA internalization-related competence protein ComEC/Rec2 [Phoenicibacter congonensis]
GICCQVKVSKFSVLDANPLAFIISARKAAIENFAKHSGGTAGLLQALVCGYRDTIRNDGTYEAFRTCGLAHIVAVSGAHLAIVTATFMLLLKKLRVSRKVTAAITTVMVLCYLIFAGIPISAIRAACMVLLGLLAGLFGRRANPLNALALCVVVILVSDPTASMSISLLLSAGSTFGIILFARLFESWFDAGRGKINSFFVQPTSLTLSSNLMTLPISAAIFSQVSTIALVANIIATPLFSLACVLGLIAACVSCIFPPLASLVCGAASLAAYPLHFATTVMSKIPFACIAVQFDVIVAIIISAIFVLLLLGYWPRFSRKQIAAVCCAVLIAPFLFVFVSPLFTPDRIVFLDVGQGDAILIQSCGKNVLIDTGKQATKLKTGLAKRGVFKLDAVIITHHDDDHMGCLQALSEYESIAAVYSAEEATACKCDGCGELRSLSTNSSGGDLKGLSVGDKISVGKFKCEVVWPSKFTDEGGNSDSLSLLISSDVNSDGNSEMTLLTTGDAESESINKMISECGVSQIDVLKVAHHGSKVSLDDKLLDSLNPKIGVISVGVNNRYGHPKQETLDFLAKHDMKSLRTDEHGSITITPNASSFSVTTES